MVTRHEWDIDFEPARRRPRDVNPPWQAPPGNGWAHPRVTRAVNVFWKAVCGSLGAVASIGLTVIGLGALWLLSAALTGF